MVRWQVMKWIRMKVTLEDGSYHDVDSDQLSFELAAKMGYKAAAKAAGAVIMEPIMKLEVLLLKKTWVILLETLTVVVDRLTT